MADYTITPANVDPDADYPYGEGDAGVAISAGEMVYYDTADDLVKLMDADVAVDSDLQWGMALNTAAVGQPVRFGLADSLVTVASSALGTVGAVAVVSANAGKLAPQADLTTGKNLYYAVVFVTTTKVLLILINPEITVP